MILSSLSWKFVDSPAYFVIVLFHTAVINDEVIRSSEAAEVDRD